MTYSKLKAKERKAKMKTIEDRLKLCEEKIADAPTPENLINLESVRAEYEREFDFIVRGSIIRSRATWYEQGERNTKYFLNLEDNKKKKSCIRKLLQSDGKETSDANVILNEIYSFYSDLSNENLEIQTDFRGCPFLKNPSMSPKLSDAMKEACDGQLSYSECFKVLSTFENNKSPGNDGLSIEFYKFFWPEIGTLLVDSLNYSYIHGELSNLQKEAVITLIEKKDRDRRLIRKLETDISC